MRPLSALLDRFRRAAGVPAAVGGDLEAELEPALAALEDIEGEAARLGERAAAEAEERLAHAREEAARISGAWRERAEAERARASAECRRRAEQDCRAILAAAEMEAEQVLARGRARIPGLVERVVACVREAER